MPVHRPTAAPMFKCRICNMVFISASALAVHKKSNAHKRAAKSEMELDKTEDEVQVGISSLSM